MSKTTKRVLLVLLLLATVAVVGMVVGRMSLGNKVSNLRRQVEAEKAVAAEIIVARTVTERELKERVRQVEVLTTEIKRIKEIAPKVEIKEVVRWRTKEIEVPIEKIIEVPVEKLVEVDKECPALPDVAFDVRGAEARVESRAGNLFAVGNVELWRVKPPPDTFLGAAPFEATVTEYLARDPRRTTRWRSNVLLGWSEAGADLAVTYQHSRIGFYARGSYDPSPPMTQACVVRDLQLYSCVGETLERTQFGAGILFTLGRR